MRISDHPELAEGAAARMQQILALLITRGFDVLEVAGKEK